MLDTLRKNSKSAVIYVFFFIIIVVFIFSFGPGSNGCRTGARLGGGSDTVAATVNGKKILAADFEQTYARVYRDYQARAGGSFNEELAQSLGLKGKVLDQLIERELLAQAAEAHGLVVSDQELANQIRGMAAFQTEGKFDEEQYKLIVERQLMSNRQRFEAEMRNSLLAQKMLGSLAGSVRVSDDEVSAEYAREKEKLDLGFVRFAPHAFTSEVANPTQEQIDAFLKTDSAKVEEHYKNNSYQFNKPKRVHARHILIKLAEDASQADVDAAKKQLADVKVKVAAGGDFASLAKELSQDPGSKDKGGDLGVFGPGTMDPAFQTAAFALKAGEVSEPVRTRFGMHLIKVEEVLPEENRSLEDAKREIANELLVEQSAKQLAKAKAEETLAQAKQGKSIEEQWPAAEKPGDEEGAQPQPLAIGHSQPQAESTGPFPPTGEYIPRIGSDSGLAADVLALDEKQPVANKVFEINGNFYVVVLKSHERADMKELEAKKDEYREKARSRKAGEVTEAYLKALREKASIERDEKLLGPASGAEGALALDDE
jgi:peptidyl-prolyl cis-trans isomerase D